MGTKFNYLEYFYSLLSKNETVIKANPDLGILFSVFGIYHDSLTLDTSNLANNIKKSYRNAAKECHPDSGTKDRCKQMWSDQHFKDFIDSKDLGDVCILLSKAKETLTNAINNKDAYNDFVSLSSDAILDPQAFYLNIYCGVDYKSNLDKAKKCVRDMHEGMDFTHASDQSIFDIAYGSGCLGKHFEAKEECHM